jgi:hypothetical protein
MLHPRKGILLMQPFNRGSPRPGATAATAPGGIRGAGVARIAASAARCALLLLPLTTLGRAPAASQAPAGAAPAPSLHAGAAVGVLRIDGRLDEPAWAAAAPATRFTQSFPSPGGPPSQPTEARVVLGEDALYVGMRMYDSRPDSIAAQLTRRDDEGAFSDWAHAVIDSYHDRRTAFRFSVNPRGVKRDVAHVGDGSEDASWDAVWDVATSVDSLGWTAEFKIPLSQLRFSSRTAGVNGWGLQLMRDIARYQERDSWAPWTRNDPGFVSRFGTLTGVESVRRPRGFEVLPYVSSRVERGPGAAGLSSSTGEASASLGADLKYGFGSGLTLTATLNPDFGQVEVDPATINLTAFETFLTEQRPIFVEGAEIFDFGRPATFNSWARLRPFYSRRVGRAPQRELHGAGFEAAEQPAQTTIASAVKLSGKTRSGWTVGALDAVTLAEHARFTLPDGSAARAEVEPLTNYFVGRLRRDLRAGATAVGGMLTAVNRDLSDPALAPLLRSSAYLAGVDFDHSWMDRRWNVNGFLAHSRVQGSREAILSTQRSSARYFQRPDAGYLSLDPERTRLDGHAGALTVQKVGGGHWLGSLTYEETSPGFELNDGGFQSRADARALSTYLAYRENRPSRGFHSYTVYGFSNTAWNFGGLRVSDTYGLGADTRLRSFWRVNATTIVNPATHDDRLTRGGPLSRTPAAWQGLLTVHTDPRRELSGRLELAYRTTRSGEYDRIAAAGVDLRPSRTVRVGLGPRLVLEYDPDQYVRSVPDPLADETFGQRYVFANVSQTVVSLDGRLDWTFSPTLSLQLFAQPYVAVGDFSGYKELRTPGRFLFDVYGRDRGTVREASGCAAESAPGGGYALDPDGAGPADCFHVGEQDFNYRSLRGNAVLRWEYRPGSALFLVWQQDRFSYEQDGRFRLGREYGELFRRPAEHVLLVKATYWLGR